MAYGLIPAYHMTGGVIRAREYAIATGYGTNIFSGDVVSALADGTIDLGLASSDALLNVGVFYGVSYKDAAGNITYSRYWPASTTATEIKAYVYDDPHIVFRVESDQDTTALAATSVFINADYIQASVGSTVTGQSAGYIDSSTLLAASGAFKILGSAEVDGTWTAAGTVMDVYVTWNEHMSLVTSGV